MMMRGPTALEEVARYPLLPLVDPNAEDVKCVVLVS